MRHSNRLAVMVAAIALVAAACGSSSKTTTASGGDTTTVPTGQKSIGAGEGAVSILAWPGYAENGSNDPKVNWVKPFEAASGCKATVKYFGTSDEAFNLFKTGAYDVVSSSGDATLRMVADQDAAVINTSLLTNWNDLDPLLTTKPWNSVNGVVYGVPHGWGANLLMYNKNVVKPAPDSWGAVFDATSPYKGKITGYDSPIYIADGALYLMKTKPDLGIKDPYALDDTQFQAVVDLMKVQRPLIGEYWSDYLKEQEAFTKGSLVLGTTWQITTNGVLADKASPPVDAIIPKEGSTAWSDSWMIDAKAKHPNCAYKWINWVTNPDTQAQIAEYFGEAPANLKACSLTTDKNHCKAYHAGDATFYGRLSYWKTPTAKCLDGRADVTCKDYAAWTAAWDEIKG
ncbi:MAG: putative spermidine/putrescine transport system substrate-binding protein [Actinomycetota bacterium]|nr:putative spermidine/putrescine transport system substrate-binding protein [Actinomycetota bacterium]